MNNHLKITYLSNRTTEQLKENGNIFVFNACEYSAGRLATMVSHVLQGKHFILTDKIHRFSSLVIVYNLDKLVLTGKKEERDWHFFSGFKLRKVNLDRNNKYNINKIFFHIVKCMLPKNRTQKFLLKNIITYLDDQFIAPVNSLTLNQKFQVEQITK